MSKDSYGEVRIPTIHAALVRRLGRFPFWRREKGFVPALEKVYRQAAAVGMDVFLGERMVGKGTGLDPSENDSV